mgnify:CR=1 FL=1
MKKHARKKNPFVSFSLAQILAFELWFLHFFNERRKLLDDLFLLRALFEHDPPHAAADDGSGINRGEHSVGKPHVLPFFPVQMLINCKPYLFLQQFAHEGAGVAFMRYDLAPGQTEPKLSPIRAEGSGLRCHCQALLPHFAGLKRNNPSLKNSIAGFL